MPEDDDENIGNQSDVGHTPLPQLPEDHDTPFGSPPTRPSPDPTVDTDLQSQSGRLDPTHQVTDTNIEQEEVYDEGLSGAAEAEEPNPADAVVDYDPKKDGRRNS